MKLRYLALCAVSALPAGCTLDPTAGTDTAALGYRYHDANHPNGLAQPSPQAIENARRGVWLWPPAASLRAG